MELKYFESRPNVVKKICSSEQIRTNGRIFCNNISGNIFSEILIFDNYIVFFLRIKNVINVINV